MKLSRLLFGTACALLLAVPAIAGGVRPVVVELFTSQGCSSCPPADALLGRLSQRHGVLAMSLPIDYWDMLGWKDTLAIAANTHRQKAYAAAMGHGGVYTPQIIVDGLNDVVGSREGDVEAAIARRMAELEAARAHMDAHLAAAVGAREAALAEARATTDAERAHLIEARDELAAARSEVSRQAHASTPAGRQSVPVSVRETADAMHIEVGSAAAKSDGPATVWLFHLRNAVTVNVGAGENDGRTLTYHNVVADLRSVGEWSGDVADFDLPRTSLQGLPHDAVAVVVQHGGYGRVVGATLISHPDYEESH